MEHPVKRQMWVVTIRSTVWNPRTERQDVSYWTTSFGVGRTPIEFLSSLRKDKGHSIVCAFLQPDVAGNSLGEGETCPWIEARES